MTPDPAELSPMQAAVLLMAYLERRHWRFGLDAHGGLMVTIGEETSIPQAFALEVLGELREEILTLVQNATIQH